ncbi:MAG: hypothetical protein MJ175_07190, partial [Clostridia bacterium]|nr:hypothetical protein [Clostridia bacterium]
RLNLKYALTTDGSRANLLYKAVTAGDPPYDAAVLRFSNAYSKSQYCLDLLSLENLSVNASWWDQNSVRDLSIAGVLRMITGDIFYRHYDGVQVLLFNKNIAKDYDIENLYDCVTEGRWTVEKMGEVCRLTTRELDGNGKMDRYDQWGYASQNNDYLPALINACGMRLIQKDENDIPYCSIDIEKTSNMLEQYSSYYKDCTFDIGRDAHYENLCAFWIFPEGRSLLYWAAVHYIPWKLRDIDFDFGILPIPKYDESQAEYISALTPYHSYCYMIPKSAGDPEDSAYIMDALGFYGENIVKDVYYDSCLKRKYSNDEESFAMLDIIFNNIVYDLGAYADFGNFCNYFSDIFTNKSEVDIASVYAKFKTKIETGIDKYISHAIDDLK